MSYTAKVKRGKSKRAEIQKYIRGLGGAIVLKHALGTTEALYQIYPVGPESAHKDGSPHTRDTFAIVETDGNPSGEGAKKVLASKGKFGGAGAKFEFGPKKGLSLIAGGASFFVEFGTINMEARPLIRQFVKRARADITKELRRLNIRLSSR